MQYPKINNLWKRQGLYFEASRNTDSLYQLNKQPFIIGDYTCSEFASVSHWEIDEKINGIHVRILFDKDTYSLSFSGKDNECILPKPILTYLHSHFTIENMSKYFYKYKKVILFGEGYGNTIKSSGSRYRHDVSFCLFDALLDGIWREKRNVIDISNTFHVEHPPTYPIMEKKEIIDFVLSKPKSLISKDPTLTIEGVVARSQPMMLFRNNMYPIMFKLKVEEGNTHA